MQPHLLREFRARRISIRGRWEALLHAEPVASPLGLPDALVHLIDTTLAEAFTLLEGRSSQMKDHEATETPSSCPCSRNPLLAYFTAAEQALREGLILAQAASAPLDPVERDGSLEELNAVLQHISRREIEAFCGVCQFREQAEHHPPLLIEAHR